MNSQPTASPPPNRCAATSGNRARGIASTIAARSTAKESRSTGARRMYARPARTCRHPALALLSAGGSAGSRTVAHSAPVNATASTAYARATSDRARSTPAASGPATPAAVAAVVLTAFAAGSSGAGTSRGTIACLVGELTANATACRATSPSNSTGLSTRSSAWTNSPSVADHMTRVETSNSRRRSTASATAPPQSAKVSKGTSPATPINPTHSEEWVSWNISTGTATAVSWKPKLDTP